MYKRQLLAGLRRVAELGGLPEPPKPAALESWLSVVSDDTLRKAIEAHRKARAAIARLLPAAGAAAAAALAAPPAAHLPPAADAAVGAASKKGKGKKRKGNKPRTQRVMAAAIFASGPGSFSADALAAAVNARVANRRAGAVWELGLRER